MTVFSQQSAANTSATGAITLAAFIGVALLIIAVLYIVDHERWHPFATKHNLQRTGTINPAPWGEPFRDDFTAEIPFSGVVRGVPVTMADYWHAKDYDSEGSVKGKWHIHVCVLDLGRPLGRLHVRNRTRPGPLRKTMEYAGPPIGHAGFDQRYDVTVDDPRLRAYLLSQAFVDLLAAAPDIAGFRVVGHELVLIGTEQRQRRGHFETLYELADGLVARLPADMIRPQGQWAT